MKNLKKIFYSQLSDKLGRINRKLWRNWFEKRKLKNKNFSILSQNCIGGIIYHDLGQKFLSPTVNLLFSPQDFIVFLKNIHYYLEKEIVFLETEEKYPIGKLGDLTIKFLHYNSKESALNSWNERKKRINWENIFIICCDEELNEEDILEFDRLPYKNKIIFVHKKMPGVKSAIVAKDFNDKTDARILNFANPLGKRFYQNYIDYVAWLNLERRLGEHENERENQQYD